MSEWQPIETAKRTRQSRLVWCPAYRNIYIVSWHVPLGEDAQPDPTNGRWVHFGGSTPLRERATHWMPLPEAPKVSK